MNMRSLFTGATIWGKIIGAFLGFLIAGPMGALFGILIGNFFDRGLALHFNNPHWHFHAEKRKSVQKLFFEATFLTMGFLAKSDGHVSEQEIHFAKTLMQELGLNDEQQKIARELFTKGKQAQFEINSILTPFYSACKDNPELLKLFIDIQYRVAKVDGFTPKKLFAINSMLSHLGFAPMNQQRRFYDDFLYYEYDNTRARQHQQQYSSPPPHHHTHSSLDKAFAILEIPSSSNKQEVKHAYRKLMSQNHPDKLIAQGLPEEMIKLANVKTHRIREAYDTICAAKGW